MPFTMYDIKNADSIIDGEGDWFSAHLMRFLYTVLSKADQENFIKLYQAYSSECRTICISKYGWTQDEIYSRMGI
jgi:hypothetical protein